MARAEGLRHQNARTRHRLRRPGHQPLDREQNWLAHPETRTPHALPHLRDPGRAPHHHRRRPAPRRSARRHRPHPGAIRCALTCHNSGPNRNAVRLPARGADRLPGGDFGFPGGSAQLTRPAGGSKPPASRCAPSAPGWICPVCAAIGASSPPGSASARRKPAMGCWCPPRCVTSATARPPASASMSSHGTREDQIASRRHEGRVITRPGACRRLAVAAREPGHLQHGRALAIPAPECIRTPPRGTRPPESQQHPAAWWDHRRQRASPAGPIPQRSGG